MVIAKEMADGSQATSYEHGFWVGFKASYAGVSISNKSVDG